MYEEARVVGTHTSAVVLVILLLHISITMTASSALCTTQQTTYTFFTNTRVETWSTLNDDIVSSEGNRRQCSGGFPLKIVLSEKADGGSATSVESTEFQPELIQALLPKLDWEAFVETATQLGLEVPPTYSEEDKNDEHFLRAVHDAALDFHLVEGKLVCPLCKREYPVTNGIPNMLLQDDEV